MSKHDTFAKRIARMISVMLIASMVFATVPAFAQASGNASAAPVQGSVSEAAAAEGEEFLLAEAVAKFTEAMSKFATDTAEMSTLSSFLTRFGGVTSIAGGVLGILQMTGIIRDSTTAALSEILDEIHNMQDKLNEMDNKLDRINKQLVDIAVVQEEKDRSNNADKMLDYWNNFNSKYCEPMDQLMEVYQGKINEGIKAWWQQKSHDGVYAIYTTIDNEAALTYSNAAFSSGMPAKADNGEAVAPAYSIGVPARYMPDTASIKFGIDTYRDDFEKAMAASIIKAADANRLIADKNGPFANWRSLSSTQKQELATSYAKDILNTQIYRIACDVMSENDSWVIEVTGAYKNYCSNVLNKNTGVNAMLNAMYLTHAFEGEIKEEIEEFCDAMVAQTGVYGQFALTCACQDNMQSASKREAVQKQYANTILKLADRKKQALTGHPNYCYITGTLLEYKGVTARSNVAVTYKSGAYKGYTSNNWSIELPHILNSIYSQVLFHQYQTLDQGNTSFTSYLNSYGVKLPSASWSGEIMTNYGGPQVFSLSEGVRMQAIEILGEYFSTAGHYNIDVGTGGKVEQKYYHIHDKVTYDAFDMRTGALSLDKIAGARAFYGESHWYWETDEAHFFFTDNMETSYTHGETSGVNYINCKTSIPLSVLALTPCTDRNGGGGADDPISEYESITEGGDIIGPAVVDDKKALTDAVVKGGGITYTGKAVKPQVTVKAGKKTVPASGYKITYLNNQEFGYATFTVTGKGKYSGKVSREFRILPAGSRIKNVRRTGRSAKISWKKQAAKMPSHRITGYQIRYSTGKNMKNANKITVTGYKKTSSKVTGLDKNKKYYFQVRTFVKTAKGNVYSKWSSKFSK